ncbi:serine/threonine-protein kinase [Chondromyces apiculatus]|uniref:Protein kinase domain-containing protein n=1 Tax=Chondromyces apiculatus DSM 436 TaxID=1192034 RepID=A0A017TBN6_9BACT|nr:serine/threonine-protein kinase [Chondromyces apiculatus]EYF06639.1 Hypothetical protein CAP_1769 [Chondromyces apiculatus DSM 436]
MKPGDLISGKYRLLRPLGSGGMGSVWAVRNELTHRDFAIKVLLPELSKNREALQRFFQEARVCGQIRHPAVVDVFDMGQAEDGAPYIVMELLEGEGLDTRLKTAGAVPPAEAAEWMAFVARGLEEAHVRGVVHRDLKPGNIFLARQPTGEIVPKILDFGVSKASGAKEADHIRTMSGAVLGSPAYMSPEQARGEEEIDGRSDIWSLGVMLYEALTAQHPFVAANYNALMVAIMTQPHAPLRSVAPEVPPELAAVVDRMLTKDRAQRIGQARELAERLEAALAAMPADVRHGMGGSRRSMGSSPSLSVGASGASRSGRLGMITEGSWSKGRGARSRPGVVVGVALGAAVLAAGGVLAATQWRSETVPMAARSSSAVVASLARVERRLAELKEEAAAAEQARLKAEEQARLAAEEQARAERAAQAAKALNARPSATPRRSVHGGVENPGF